MIHIDRREIAPLLLPHFPEMEGASSDEWHAFLDQVTGLATPLDEQNATAFDRWRQALAAMDIPVWSITPSAAAAMKARGVELTERAAAARMLEAKRRAHEIERLKSFETRPSGAPQDEGSA
jgi:hypothetical protein